MGNKPISIVIFGITGDLARTKLLPALYDLYRKKLLPKDFAVIGYGRKGHSPEEFASLVCEAAIKKNSSESIAALRERRAFIDRCTYVQGELEEKQGYDKLRGHIVNHSRTIFFLSVHPELHQTIIKQLGKEKLLKKNSQLMIEKPFGHDAETARSLDRKLLNFVNENQIYRIDHYLGKAALLDLIERRKKDHAFEKAIEGNLKAVEVALWETKTVASRGNFYDAVGALKDVGQNHLLQMVSAVIGSSHIFSNDAQKVRKARAAAIASLRLKLPAARAQYNLYHSEQGVAEKTRTETFFSVSAISNLPKHKDIMIALSAGKALSESSARIKLIFKKPVKLREGTVSEVVYELNGKTKKKDHQPMEAYERVFLAAIDQDLSFFCSLDEVIAGWKFDRSVRDFWKKHDIALQYYRIGEAIHTFENENKKSIV